MAGIPMDLIGEILCRCPVKSVIRFKTVSLEWFALVSSPDFVSQHLRCSRAPIVIHACSDQPLHHYLLSYGLRSVVPAILHLLHDFPHLPLHVLDFIGSPNGVVCVVRNFDIQYFTLWNPFTASPRPLPAPTLIFDREAHTRVCVGMGFDPSTGDYKIVRLLERRFNLSDQVEVLSVNRGGWTVSTTHNSRMMMTGAPCVVANGVPYWVGAISSIPGCTIKWKRTKSRAAMERDEEWLVWFDVANERFCTEEFPWVAERSGTLLGVRDDCLCAMVWEDGVMHHRFDLWVKERDVWRLRYAGVEPPRDGLVVRFCGDRGIVYSVGGEQDRLLVFDPTGVEDVVEINMGDSDDFEVTHCVRVLGWKDGLTEIPQLGNLN